MKYLTSILIGGLILFNCSCGTLSGFDSIHFSVGKDVLENAIDSLYNEFPQYQIPPKWQKFDDWNKRGYGFLDARIFYFSKAPEEMYYVTFIGDSTTQTSVTQSEIAIRAVSNGSERWYLEEDVKGSEKKRIQTRFKNEIVLKLEEFTQTHAY